ncbi:hypothetical protein [Halorussus aquaticus]|uniref:hypothetical protein n=1 Tax=Halorussus aquaticus TaxID=2953748 RepID=UPI0020B7F627|nr:hypothetical protein [Halorussus aquaticus]
MREKSVSKHHDGSGTTTLVRETVSHDMGDPACYLEFCPDCDAQVTIADEECPDCGADIE